MRDLIQRIQYKMGAVFVLAVAGAFTTFASVSAATPGFICASYGGGLCASLPPGGTAFSGEGVATYSIGSAWRWYENSEGTVTGSYPFNTGWLNNAYLGHSVIRFQLKANTGYCMSNDSDFIVIYGCTTNRPQLWVVSGNWLVNVSSSDNHNARWVMTKINSQVFSRHGGDYSANNQNWGWQQG